MTKRYLRTTEEVTQALREGKTVQTNEMEYGIINNLIVGFDKIVREISINPAIRLSENPYINEPYPLLGCNCQFSCWWNFSLYCRRQVFPFNAK